MSGSVDGGAVHHEELRKLDITNQRGTLARRIAWVAAVSVFLSGGIAIAVAYPLVQNEAQLQARDQLSRQADVLTDVLRDNMNGGPGRSDMGRAQIGNHVVVIPVNEKSQPIGPITEVDIAAVLAGNNVSAVREVGGSSYFLEGRAIDVGKGIILVEHDTVTQGPTNTLLLRMAVALLSGLVMAIVLAVFVARRTARPLNEAAHAAARLAQGDRAVDVDVSGPIEVAEIAEALNQLAENLALSEDRQREFLMSVSHELRTPMTSIKGYAEALADGVIESGDSASTGELLVGETNRLDRLISDLLDLARAGAVDFRLSPAVVDLNAISSAAAGAWKLRCEKENLAFNFESVQREAISDVDATRVRQIIDNLMENAVRVTPAGGQIRLSLQVESEENVIRVDDSGPGLSDDDLEIAFEPAVLHSRYRGVRPVGTGLGLALVGRLAARMNGTVQANHSSLGGAQFEVKFPVVNLQQSQG